MKQIISIFLLLIIIDGLTSCKNEEPMTTCLGYSFITSYLKGANQDTVFGIGFSTVTNKIFSSVEVVHSVSQATYTLAAIENHANNFGYETPFEDMTGSLPEIGKYLFSYTLTNNESLNSTDSVTSDVLYPAIIDTCYYNKNVGHVELKWEPVTNANYIHVFLKNNAGKRVFATKNALTGTSTSTNISETTNGWIVDYVPNANETYIVEIIAFRYKKGSTNSVRDGIQARSVATETVAWGTKIQI